MRRTYMSRYTHDRGVVIRKSRIIPKISNLNNLQRHMIKSDMLAYLKETGISKHIYHEK